MAAPAAVQTEVKFARDWRFEGSSAPYLLAADRGYHEKAVTAFLSATIKGLRDAIADPAARAATVVARNDEARPEIEQ